MKRILFLDVTCPAPYDLETLRTLPQGGTESTVTRIAEALGNLPGLDVAVAQYNRTQTSAVGAARYISLDDVDTGRCSAVIALRTPKIVPHIRACYPDAKPLLWCHDFNQLELVQAYPVLKDTGLKVIGVSRTHATAIKDALLTMIGEVRGVSVTHIYNPIDDALVPDATPVDRNKLLFFSSPHKGLKHTLELFETLRRDSPELTLYVANPGYFQSDLPLPPGVTDLGALSHAQALHHVRTAFAVFHPNTVFPETFGLVYAESNAVGTPCLTHQIAGTADARAEVLGVNSEQVIDCRNTELVVKRFREWQVERPPVSVNPKFRMSAVLNKWKEILDV